MHLHSQIEADVTRTPTTPLAAYISDYLIACEAGSAMKRPLSARTIACYRKAMRELDHLMGGADLSGFTEARVAPIISAKRKTSASNARLLAAVSKAFSTWLYRKHHTGGNRLEDLGVPAFNARRQAFTDKELIQIQTALTMLPNRTRKRDRALVLFSMGSGVRSNEARLLGIADVHIERPLSRSWAFIRWDHTKSQRQRSVRIADEAAAAIHEYTAADRPEADGPLFLSEHGKPYSYDGWGTMWARIADRMEEFGIKDFGAHRLRHQWATLAARERATQRELEQEGGWERGSKVPAHYIDEIPFEEIQRKPSPLTSFMKRAG